MKQFLTLIAALLCFTAMAQNDSTGVKVLGPTVPNSPLDKYPTGFERWMQGGYKSVNSISERNAIDTLRRKIGMAVRVMFNDTLPANDSIYTLTGGLTDEHWKNVTPTGSQSLKQVTAVGDSTPNRLVSSALVKGAYIQAADTADAWNYDSVYFFGNSITAGLGATPQGVYSWTHIYSLKAGAIEMNNGIGSTTLVKNFTGDSSFEERYRTALPYWSAGKRHIIIGYGVNDVLSTTYPIDTAVFRTKYGMILDTAIIGRSIPAGKIVCWLPYYNNAMDSLVNIIISQVATSRGCVFVNVRDSFRLAGGISLFVDHVHPNNRGHAVIARALINGYLTPVTNYTLLNQSALVGGNLYVGRNIMGGTAPGGLGLRASRFLYGRGRITSYDDHYFSRYVFADTIWLGASDAFAGVSGPLPYINFGNKFASTPITSANAYMKFPANACIGVSSNAVGGMTFNSGSLIRFVFTGADINTDRNINVAQGINIGTSQTGAVTTPYSLYLGNSFANAPVSKVNLKLRVWDSTGIGVDTTNGLAFLSNARSKITSMNNHYFLGSIFGNNIFMGSRGPVSTATPLTLDMGDTYSDEVNRPSKAKLKLFGSTDADAISLGVTSAAGLEIFAGTPNLTTFRSRVAMPNIVGSAAASVVTLGIDSLTGQIVKKYSSGGGGTVSSVSASGSNGISASVTNPTTTPAITISADTSTAGSGLARKSYVDNAIRPAVDTISKNNFDDTLIYRKNGVNYYIPFPTARFVATDNANVLGVTEQSFFGTGLGDRNMPANYFRNGRTLKIRASGQYSVSSGDVTNTITVRVKVGSNTIVSFTTPALPASVIGKLMNIDMLLTTRVITGTTYIECSGTFAYEDATGYKIVPLSTMGSPVAITATSANVVDVTVQMSDGGNGISGTNGVIESTQPAINPS